MANMDRLQGKAKEAGGTVEQKTGEVTGDQDTEARGAETKMEGKGQGIMGKIKGAAEDAKEAVEEHLPGHREGNRP
ncbi:MAG: CsbD family protein [Dehalococcoidia bacterium]